MTALSLKIGEPSTRPQPGKDHPPRDRLLASLAAEPAKSAYSAVVLAGMVRASEFLIIAATGALVHRLYVAPTVGYESSYFVVVPAVAILSLLAFQTLHAYHPPALRQPMRQVFRILGGWAFVFLAAFAAIFFLKLDGVVSRVWVVGWFSFGLLLLAIERAVLSRIVHSLTRSGRLVRRAAVVGGGEFGGGLLRALGATQAGDIRVLGVFDDRSDNRSPETIEGFPKLGNIDDLVDLARHTRIDLVIFAMPITAERRILEMLRKLCVLPIDIRLAAHANPLRFRPRSYSYLGQVPVLDILDKPIADWDVVIKAAFDKIIGSIALIVLSPILLATTLAVKLDSPGPALFRQKRYGFNNEMIEVFKFRSMYVNQADATAARLVTRQDPRVTRVGRFIRKTSLDELPQLFNVVFKGDLSLVGPRPHAVHAKAANRQYDEVVDGYFARHRVRPGITGWAQINGWRGETDTPEKIQQRVEHDLFYIENWSIFLDLYILAVTPYSLVKASNAY